MRHAVFTAAVLAGCHGEAVIVGELQEVAQLKAAQNPNLDILFVIDDSGSMGDTQASLAENFPRMMDVLEELDGGLPNLHIGVVTSDMGTTGTDGAVAPGIGQLGNGGCAGAGKDGALQTNNTAGVTATFLSDIALADGTREKNYVGELRDVFASIALAGIGGCGFEQHLHAMQRSFLNPANAGFLRFEANLAVIVIADEDDCSMRNASGLLGPETAELGPLQSFRCTRFGVECDQSLDSVGAKTGCAPKLDSLVEDVQPFVDSLVTLKGDDRKIMVAGVIGDPDPFAVRETTINGQTQLALTPSCTLDGPNGAETAEPGVRLAAFLDAFPGRSQRATICSPDLSSPMGQIGASAKRLVGDPCLDSSQLVDASPDPGVQPACEVLDIRDSAPDAPELLPECASGAGTCYEMVADPIACPSTVDHLRIRFRRSAAAADDTWTSIRCQLR
ncbi:MAG: vWA domain-containing protein [Kofleriaceae bacterium]